MLVVNDNAEMRTLIRSVLRDVAQEFVECASGEEAVATFPVERPDWSCDGLRHAGHGCPRRDARQIKASPRGQHPDHDAACQPQAS